MISLVPFLTPHGTLALSAADDGSVLDEAHAARLERAFARGGGHGLLSLGVDDAGAVLAPVLSWWREFGVLFVTALCALPNVRENGAIPTPAVEAEKIARLAQTPPIMTGAEYLTADVLVALWTSMSAALNAELAESGHPLQDFLKHRNPAWNLVGRVHFNLAENPKDPEAPFAFLATYTPRLSAQARAQHLPLGQALSEYAGAANRDRLLSLLTPVQNAAAKCAWLKRMAEEGEIFHPIRWTADEALRFLNDVPALESAGVVVRTPASWRMNRPPRPQVKATIGGEQPSYVGAAALLDFRLEVTLGDDTLTAKEIREILRGADGLALIRGKWVEVDRERLRKTLAQFEEAERRARIEGLTFAEAMRMLAGATVADEETDDTGGPGWHTVAAGPWLAETLKGMRHPEGLARVNPGKALRGTLRPYQRAGVEWLYLLTQLGLGACLADDMGLGKTVQILSLLLVLKAQGKKRNGAPNSDGTGRARAPSLLIAPASLIGNWTNEIAKFAPTLNVLIAHSSAMPADELKALPAERLADVDLVITTYGSVMRLPWLSEMPWRLAVLDEAQAIKNPGAKQTRAVKGVKAGARIALTGTPIENRLADLWSLFDFINPSLLGSAKQFSDFTKQLAARPHNPHGPLRDLVRPYILRRLKTDKSIIADLPDKTEVKAYCSLSPKQAALYQQAVTQLAETLEDADGIERRGIILSFLMRFKQICNHPSQWLGDSAWAEEDSGKLARLRDIAEIVASRQEKALIFTQFKETTAPLERFLGGVFGRPGLVLHGATEVKKRKELVRRFQEDESVPFFILSLKAGGTGLNLTAASHVIHFDRWWNPAVENQATDRSFRIGQTRNVLVHKFVCRGTIEDKIDQMIDSKQRLAGDFLENGVDMQLTEMRDDELLKLVALDLAAAAKEA